MGGVVPGAAAALAKGLTPGGKPGWADRGTSPAGGGGGALLEMMQPLMGMLDRVIGPPADTVKPAGAGAAPPARLALTLPQLYDMRKIESDPERLKKINQLINKRLDEELT